jgi:hypothetical protein
MCFQPVLIRVSVSLISSNLGGLLRPTFGTVVGDRRG